MKTKYFLSAIVAMLLSSCGTLPRINCDDGRRAHVGMSQSEVISLMGDPYFASLSRDVTVFGWQDNEQFYLSKETLRVTINPMTKIVKKIEGSCAQ